MKKKNRKLGKKFFAALALGIFVISGLAVNVSALTDSSFPGDSYGAFKEVRNNPLDLLKTEKLLVPPNFDYVKELD